MDDVIYGPGPLWFYPIVAESYGHGVDELLRDMEFVDQLQLTYYI